MPITPDKYTNPDDQFNDYHKYQLERTSQVPPKNTDLGSYFTILEQNYIRAIVDAINALSKLYLSHKVIYHI